MDPFLAEIRIFPYNFAPKGWALCNGQLLPITQNTALFSLLGNIYGGDGRSTFALPNLQGMVAVSSGQSPGNSPWSLGQTQGTSSVTLAQPQMPGHNHALNVTSTTATQTSATSNQLGKGQKGGFQSSTVAKIYSANTPGTPLAPSSLTATGGNQPHNNMMPYLALNFCIALTGIFPPRS